VPGMSIVLGALLILTVALLACLPDLRSCLETRVAEKAARSVILRARLPLAAVAGVVLIVSGSVGSSVRGTLRSRWSQRAQQREIAQRGATDLLERAKEHLSAGNVQLAELVLLEANATGLMDRAMRQEIEGLLERVRRSGDPEVIFDLLIHLPQEEFEALEERVAVPQVLQFQERALTRRAVQIAFAQIEDAKRTRARH